MFVHACTRSSVGDCVVRHKVGQYNCDTKSVFLARIDVWGLLVLWELDTQKTHQ